MEIEKDRLSAEAKWAISTKGLTTALAAHLDVIYNTVGKSKYAELLRPIWAQIGQASAQMAKDLQMKVDDAKTTAETGAAVCMVVMGPELRIEQVEASEEKTVLKVIECPWRNRMNDLGISHDLFTACDATFWSHFVKGLTPHVSMRHGKQMHRGDPYCEWIFEAKAR